MTEPNDIVLSLAQIVQESGPRDLVGKHIVVTAGPTYEAIDPVRFIGNRSSGKWALRSRNRRLVEGTGDASCRSVALETPARRTTRKNVESAREMAQAVLPLVEQNPPPDCIVMAAAVADHRPSEVSPHKRKSRILAPHRRSRLWENPDILRALGVAKQGIAPLLVGFAAETQDLDAYARRKLREKGCDNADCQQRGRSGQRLWFGYKPRDDPGAAGRRHRRGSAAAYAQTKVAQHLESVAAAFAPARQLTGNRVARSVWLTGLTGAVVVDRNAIAISDAAVGIGFAVTAADRHETAVQASGFLAGARCVGASTDGGVRALTEQTGFAVERQTARTTFPQLAKPWSRRDKPRVRFADVPHLAAAACRQCAGGEHAFGQTLHRFCSSAVSVDENLVASNSTVCDRCDVVLFRLACKTSDSQHRPAAAPSIAHRFRSASTVPAPPRFRHHQLVIRFAGNRCRLADGPTQQRWPFCTAEVSLACDVASSLSAMHSQTQNPAFRLRGAVRTRRRLLVYTLGKVAAARRIRSVADRDASPGKTSSWPSRSDPLLLPAHPSCAAIHRSLRRLCHLPSRHTLRSKAKPHRHVQNTLRHHHCKLLLGISGASLCNVGPGKMGRQVPNVRAACFVAHVGRFMLFALR